MIIRSDWRSEVPLTGSEIRIMIYPAISEIAGHALGYWK
jgi:hypothetical protein